MSGSTYVQADPSLAINACPYGARGEWRTLLESVLHPPSHTHICGFTEQRNATESGWLTEPAGGEEAERVSELEAGVGEN